MGLTYTFEDSCWGRKLRRRNGIRSLASWRGCLTMVGYYDRKGKNKIFQQQITKCQLHLPLHRSSHNFYVYTLVYVCLRLHSCTSVSSFTPTYAYYLGLRLAPKSTPVTLMYALHLDVYTFRYSAEDVRLDARRIPRCQTHA